MSFDTQVNSDMESRIAFLENKLNLYLDFAESSFTWNMFLSPTGQLYSVSPYCIEICGYSSDEIMDNPALLAEMVHVCDKKKSGNDHINELLNTDTIVVEYRIVTKNGATKWIEHIKTKKYNSKGTFIGYFSTIKDITTRKEVELELKKIKTNSEVRENMLKEAEHLIKFGWWEYSLESSKMIWSDEIYEIFGEDKYDETLNYTKLLQKIHPDYKEYYYNQEYLFLLVGSVEFTLPVLKVSGNYIWINGMIKSRINENGNITHFYGIIRDISTLKNSEMALIDEEEKYKNIFNSSHDLILITDINGVIKDANTKFLNFLNLSINEVVKKSVDNFISKENFSKLNALSELEVNATHNAEMQQYLGDKFYYFDVTVKKIQYSGKNQFLIVLRDVTDKKELELQLLNKIIETEENERLRFAKEIHDGVGPLLSAAKMYVQCFANPRSNMDKQVAAKSAEDLLIEAQNSIRQISFNLSPLVLQTSGLSAAIYAFIQKISEVSGLNISFVTNFKKSVGINLDTILYRVVCECVNNTIKHANATNAFIDIKQINNDIVIEYSDNGIGFDYEKVREMNVSCGLANIQNRIKTINGKLDITTAPNKGTKIVISVKNI